MNDPVRLARHEHVALLTLERPERYNALDLTTARAFEGQLEREREALVRCAAHPDAREGLEAFAQKRRPVYLPEGPLTGT